MHFTFLFLLIHINRHTRFCNTRTAGFRWCVCRSGANPELLERVHHHENYVQPYSVRRKKLCQAAYKEHHEEAEQRLAHLWFSSPDNSTCPWAQTSSLPSIYITRLASGQNARRLASRKSDARNPATRTQKYNEPFLPSTKRKAVA